MGRSGPVQTGRGRRALILAFILVVCGFVLLELVRTMGGSGGATTLTVDKEFDGDKGHTEEKFTEESVPPPRSVPPKSPPPQAPLPPQPECAHGTLELTAGRYVCECDSDPEKGFWRGPSCERCQQYYMLSTNCREKCEASVHCSNRGMCQASGWCLCQEGWGGSDCSNRTRTSEQTPIIDPTKSRVENIKAVALESWLAYKKYAWGADEYQPLTKTGENWGNAPGIGVNIVDNLDTLMMFGFTDELADARRWVETSFAMKNKNGVISVFETTIRVLGGFLSAFALSKDELYKQKAEEVAKALLPAFGTFTNMPMPFINPSTGHAFGGDLTNIAEIGTVQMELRYLSRITGNQTYNKIGTGILEFIEKNSKPGLLPTYIHTNTGQSERSRFSMGGMCDSYYEYLLKTWIMSGKQESRMRAMYDAAIEDMNGRLVRTVGNHTFISETDDSGHVMDRMDHLSCFAGGMLALDQHNVPSQSRLELATKVTSTCHESYIINPTGLAGEVTRYSTVGPLVDTGFYLLRPETIESYMYMYRMTGDQKYRDWGWEHLVNIVQHCRVPGGYAALSHVGSIPPQRQNSMPSFWMSETLKYLWLLHSDVNTYSLDKWVFTTEAHPMPVERDSTAVIGTMMI